MNLLKYRHEKELGRMSGSRFAKIMSGVGASIKSFKPWSASRNHCATDIVP